MRILVLQFARFGDIFQTWPVLAAIKRKFPLATLDLMVRERYAAAAVICPYVDNMLVFPTKTILEPIYQDDNGVEQAKHSLLHFLDAAAATAYDQIINLSFSPLSSFVVSDLVRPGTEVRGYDRQVDGFLKMADDASAYFYAQVGVERSNRYHLTDVFAAVADVVPTGDDFIVPSEMRGGAAAVQEDYVVFHLGASDAKKRIPKEKAKQILQSFIKTRTEKIYLVGTEEERISLEGIGQEFRIVDLCGRTNLADLFPLVANARALLAADSMLVQIANLTGTPTLNVTYPTVNFWETGPKAAGSRVLPFASPEMTEAIYVRQELAALLDGTDSGLEVFTLATEKGQTYSPNKDPFDAKKDFQWNLIQAMYTGGHYPVIDQYELALAFQRIQELSVLGLEQIEQIGKNNKDTVAVSILDEVDNLMTVAAKVCPEISPLVRWFMTEKSRIAPGSLTEVSQATQNIFQQLLTVTSLYSLRGTMNEGASRKDLTWK